MALLVSLVGSSLLLLFFLPYPYDESLSLILNKISMLTRTPSPRLIVVGGSGSYSGIDSPMLKEKLRFNIVNLGLYAGFGILPLLDIVSDHLNPNDIVFIIPEYGVMLKGFENDEKARKWLLAADPRRRVQLYGFNKIGITELFKDVSELIRSKLAVFPKSIFRVPSQGYVKAKKILNEYGDLKESFHKAAPGQLEGKGSALTFQFSNDPINKLNAFSQFGKDRGVNVYFIFPAFPQSEYELNKVEIDALYRRLNGSLQFPMIGKPQDFLYPEDCFLDTTNHLNGAGKKMRTERIISLFKMQN